MTRIDHTAGDAQSAESLSTESIKRGLEATARLRVERQYLAIRVLVPPRQPQKVLRRTLDDQTAFGTVLNQDRDTPSLEIEWHFVDLLPAGHVERVGRENCFIERALHAGLEPAVHIGMGINGRALGATAINGAHELDGGFSQRSGLVRAQHVHGAEIVDRGQAFTITFRLDSCNAERASVTVTIIGSSSGVSPTASASANISDSSTGR